MKSLFLKWVVVNVVVLVLIGLALWFSWPVMSELSLIGKALVIFVALVFGHASVKAGSICWQVDTDLEILIDCTEEDLKKTRKDLRHLQHQAAHIAFWANECPYWAFGGAVLGLILISGGSLHATDAAHLQETIQTLISGLGVAFVPTVGGVFFRCILSWEHHQIVHRIIWALAEES